MEKRTIYTGLLILTIIGLIASIFLLINAEDITIPLIFVAINTIGIVAGISNLEDVDKKTPVSEKELDKLHSFGREKEGSYSDWCDFSIVPETNKNKSVIRWSFCLFNEVDGKTTFVRYVDNMQQLKDVYKGITDKELE